MSPERDGVRVGFLKEGDLIGYLNIDGDTEWGFVTSDKPFVYRPGEYDEEYMAVTVIWPNDSRYPGSETNERVATILSDDKVDSGLWLQSSL